MPDTDTALNTEVEETPSGTPLDEIFDQLETDETPAAEEPDETGVTKEVEVEEPEPEHEESVPYKRFKEVNERAKLVPTLTSENERLQKQQEVFSQLVSIPEVAKVILTAANGQPSGGEVQPTDPTEFQPIPMPEELDEYEPANIALMDVLNAQARELHSLKQEIAKTATTSQTAAQTLQAQAMAKAEQEFLSILKPMETKAGVEFTDDERTAVLVYANQLRDAEQQLGREPKVDTLINQAFGIVVQPRIKKAKEATATKRGLNPAVNVNGKVAGQKQYANVTELMDDLYEQTCGQ